MPRVFLRDFELKLAQWALTLLVLWVLKRIAPVLLWLFWRQLRSWFPCLRRLERVACRARDAWAGWEARAMEAFHPGRSAKKEAERERREGVVQVISPFHYFFTDLIRHRI